MAALSRLTSTANLLWKNRDFDFFSEHGLGVSPILYKNLLIMAFDPSSRTHARRKLAGRSRGMARRFGHLTRKPASLSGEGKRGPSRLAHVTPNLMEVEVRCNWSPVPATWCKASIRTLAIAYGRSIPRCEGVVPSMVIGGGLTYSDIGFRGDDDSRRRTRREDRVGADQVGLAHPFDALSRRPALQHA